MADLIGSSNGVVRGMSMSYISMDEYTFKQSYTAQIAALEKQVLFLEMVIRSNPELEREYQKLKMIYELKGVNDVE